MLFLIQISVGLARNLTEEERKGYKETTWDDKDVCGFYMVRFCPHDLFVNTRSDLGWWSTDLYKTLTIICYIIIPLASHIFILNQTGWLFFLIYRWLILYWLKSFNFMKLYPSNMFHYFDHRTMSKNSWPEIERKVKTDAHYRSVLFDVFVSLL